jgi:hypothetical protein
MPHKGFIYRTSFLQRNKYFPVISTTLMLYVGQCDNLLPSKIEHKNKQKNYDRK